MLYGMFLLVKGKREKIFLTECDDKIIILLNFY